MDAYYEKELSAILGKDKVYQEFLNSCLSLEPEYNRILGSLSDQDRKLLEQYISFCEEMDHRALMLALTIIT